MRRAFFSMPVVCNKFKRHLSTLFCIIFFFSQVVTAQELSTTDPYAPYIGTWRWTNGKKDTLLIVVKKVNPLQFKDVDPAIRPAIIGFHSYSQNGILVESYLHKISDSLSESSCFVGAFDRRGNMSISFHDITAQNYYYGYMKIIQNDPLKAIWSIPYGREINFSMLPPPKDFRTIPDNIVFEKMQQ